MRPPTSSIISVSAGSFLFALCAFGGLNSPAAVPANNQPALEILTLNRSSGQPLPGATVRVETGKDLPAREGTTDDQGAARFELPQPGHGAVEVRVSHQGFAPLLMRWSNAKAGMPPPSRYTFRLSPSQTVGGRVLDDHGRPVRGAHVFLNFPQRLIGPHVPVEAFPINTDEAGKWTTDIVPAEATQIRVTVNHPGYVPEPSPDEPPSLAQLRDRSAVWRLQGTKSIAGRVVDPSGNPVPGAQVVYGEHGYIMGLDDDHRLTAGPGGKFQISGVTDPKVLVVAEAPGFGPGRQVVDVNGTGASVTVQLNPPSTLHGKVVNAGGQPLADVEIQANDWNNYRYPDWKAETAADGTFVVSNLPPDEVQFDFKKPGYMAILFYRLDPKAEAPIITLYPYLNVHGTVVDAKTGASVPQFNIVIGSARQGFGPDQKLINVGTYWSERSRKTFTDGSFKMTLTEPAIQGSREMPDFMLRVDAGGYDQAVSRYIKPDEGEAEIQFKLEKGGGLAGVVELPDGSPASNAQVYAMTGYDRPQLRNGQVMDKGQASEFSTDTNGVFTIPKPIEPTRLLILHDGGEAELDDTALKASSNIPLQAWGRVEGTLKVGDRIGANETVALGIHPTWEETKQGLRQVLPLLKDYETKTDAQGHFAFDRVPPGEVGILRVLDIERPMGVGFRADRVWGGCILDVVQVRPGKTTHVEVGGGGRTVTGRFVLPDGIKPPVQWNQGWNALRPALEPLPVPPDLAPGKLQDWLADWLWSEAGATDRRWLGGTPRVLPSGQIAGGEMESWPLPIETNGSFKLEDVPPGKYIISLNLIQPVTAPGQPIKPLASLNDPFTLPPAPEGQANSPFDLGELPLKPSDASAFSHPAPAAPPSKDDPVSKLAVDEPTAKTRLSAGALVHPESLHPGDQPELIVKVLITPSYHIYGMDDSDGANVPTRLDLDLPAGISTDGDWTAAALYQSGDSHPIYYRQVVFRRKLKIAPDAPAGSFRIPIKIRYQVCNELVCWPPATMSLETTGTVVSSP